MMKMKSMIGVLGAGLLAQGALAEPVDLSLKWEPGMAYQSRQTQDTEMKMPDAMGGMVVANSMVMDTTAKAAKDEKGTAVLTTFDRIKMSAKMEGQEVMAFDSTKEGQNGVLAETMQPLLDSKLTAIYDEKGKLVGMKGAEDFKGGDTLGLDRESLEQMMKQWTALVPQREVNVGERWKSETKLPMGALGEGEVTMKLDLKLAGVEEVDGKKMAKVTYTGKLDGEIGEEGEKLKVDAKDFQGMYLLDLKLGQISKSTVTMTMNLGLPQAGGARVDMKTKTVQTLLSAKKAE